MTIPSERTRAVLQTREFLLQLLQDEDTPKRIREAANHLLRHYPTKLDMEVVAEREDSHTGTIFHKVFGKGW